MFLWVEKYRPHTIEECILPEDTKAIFQGFLEQGEIAFAVDGQVSEYFNRDTKVIIEKSSYNINMINFPDSNYFHTLNLKMGWGKRGEE